MPSPIPQADPAPAGAHRISAIAGVTALAIATVIQFALGDLSEETLAGLSPVLAQPYQFVGKLCLTLPLAAFGLVLVGNAFLPHRRAATLPTSLPRPCVSQQTTVDMLLQATLSDTEELAIAEELENGEPFAEEEAAEEKPKIIALEGRFEGRLVGPPKPVAKSRHRGVELASEKYLDKARRRR